MKLRNAHSLIEMLVVLIIVGILIAIIVLAVQRARESARMAQCIHNQGQLANAIHMHLVNEPYGRFPGYRAFAADGTTQVGWAPQIFEYLGKSNLPADPTQATYVESLVCPSDQGPQDSARLSYVVNGGQPGSDSAADGIFYDHAKPLGERVFISKDDFRDGLSNTIMLAENLDATEWNVTDEANQCILWPLIAGNEVNNGTGSRPSSHHPGGFVAAFADGTVRFMSESEINNDDNVHTDQSTYVALLTPGGNDETSGNGDGSGGNVDPTTEHECLVAQWTFDDPDDPAFDDTGNGYDGTLDGCVRDPSDRGGYLYFDGNDEMTITQPFDLTGPEYTMTLWFRTTTLFLTNSSMGLINAYEPPYHHGTALLLHNHYHVAGSYVWCLHRPVLDYHGGSELFNSFSYNDGQWHHLATVKDGSTMRLYIDQAEVASGNCGEPIPQPLSIYLGRLHALIHSDTRFYVGDIDDVRVYDCALSSDEIAALP
ncbi:MAG: DUF1559 domain-containing protein [Pirellulales bacterium]|nr:DUF1559 domain-containing protein [Pirellulales bacterium]